MIAQKPLAEIAAYSVAMPAIVGLCLWLLLGPFRIDRFLSLPISGTTPEIARTAIVVPVAKADMATPTVALFPDDDGRLLAQMRGALVAKGYSVGPDGADANDGTLTALEAFQDDQALPVQPKCDQQCRTALGLPNLP